MWAMNGIAMIGVRVQVVHCGRFRCYTAAVSLAATVKQLSSEYKKPETSPFCKLLMLPYVSRMLVHAHCVLPLLF